MTPGALAECNSWASRAVAVTGKTLFNSRMRRWAWILVWLAGCQCQVPPPADAGVEDAGVTPGALKFRIADFGAVLRGESAERTATFTNSGSNAVVLTGLSTSAPFALLGADSLTVPGGGVEASVTIRYTPTTLGPHPGVLTFQSDRTLTLLLHGTGIGPSLDVAPDHLDLGTLPLYDGFPATAATGLLVRNAGIDAVPSRPETTLQFFFDVQPTSGASPGELCAGDCTATPQSLAVDAGTVVPLTLSSTTAGLKSWDVRVFSNDPGAPMKTVPVVAEVVPRPTCQFAVPAQLDFGVVTSPQSRDLEVVFENVGTEVCEVSQVEVAPQTPLQPSPLFSVVNAPTTTQTIAPGGLLRVIVRASPQGAPPPSPLLVSADLRLTINHPAVYAHVPLTAELELSCLAVAPTPLDFATVQTGCVSAERVVSLRNVCPQNVVVTSATIAGFSAFSVIAALPITLAPQGTTSVSARYAPLVNGADRNAIDVTWLAGAATKHTTVPLLGDANATGLNTDTFPPLDNRLDLLLVIDDAPSMSDKVARMSAQLPPLLAALQARNVDFHLGVVDDGDPVDGGVLRRTTTNARWLTNATPDLPARFVELTTWTGLHGAVSCDLATLRALTAPNVSDPAINGGFLRSDAALEVLCITDASYIVSVNPGALFQEVLQLKEPARLRWDVIGPAGPGTPSCGLDWIPSSPGHQLYTQATGGTILDICTSDWSPLLNAVAAQTSGERPFFPLRARPDPLGSPPMSVLIAGQAASPSAWSWSESPNAVRFLPNSAPAATDLVTISYPVACAP